MYADKVSKDVYIYRTADGPLMAYHVDANVTELLADKSIFVSNETQYLHNRKFRVIKREAIKYSCFP